MGSAVKWIAGAGMLLVLLLTLMKVLVYDMPSMPSQDVAKTVRDDSASTQPDQTLGVQDVTSVSLGNPSRRLMRKKAVIKRKEAKGLKMPTRARCTLNAAMKCYDVKRQSKRTSIPVGDAVPLKSHSLDIQRDMERCSLAMGMSPQAIKSAADTMRKISKKASSFIAVVQSIVPRDFSSQYKSSCWQLNQTELFKCAVNQLHAMEVQTIPRNISVCLPYYLIPSFPKCGTSSFHTALLKHPNIASPFKKEPHWWVHGPLGDEGRDSLYYQTAVMEYLANFGSGSQKIINPDFQEMIMSDSSQSLMTDSNFYVDFQEYCAMPAVVSRILPTVKIIVVMRNPVERLYSHFISGCLSSKGKEVRYWPDKVRSNPAVYFHERAVADIEYFNNCLQQLSLLECVSLNRFRGDECGDVGERLSIGIYYVHLLRWLQFYPREQFLFIRTEDMSANTHEVISNVTDFLGIAPVSEGKTKAMFAGRKHVLSITLEYYSTEIIMRQETRDLLKEFYAPYNSMLAKFLEDDRFLWNG